MKGGNLRDEYALCLKRYRKKRDMFNDYLVALADYKKEVRENYPYREGPGVNAYEMACYNCRESHLVLADLGRQLKELKRYMKYYQSVFSEQGGKGLC